jgi:hypothetical protein
MAQYRNVVVKDSEGEELITRAEADRGGEGILRVTTTGSAPTLSVGENYSIDGEPELHVLGELDSQSGGGVYNFKVD